MTVEGTFITLFSISTAVAIAVRRFRVPYTVALVVVGLLLGALGALDAPHLTNELLFTLFLPGLLFEAAFNLDARMPLSWAAVLTWGGMRGALSMVLALGLAIDFPHRDPLVTMTYGVVILSLLVQGLTMPWLLRWFRLVSVESARLTYDVARGHVSIADGGIAEIDRLAEAHVAAPRLLDTLRERYARRRAEWRHRLEEMHVRERDLGREEAERTVRHLLHTERSQLTERLHEGLLRRDAYEQLLAGVNERLDRLSSGKYDDVLDLVSLSDSRPASFVGPPEDTSAGH